VAEAAEAADRPGGAESAVPGAVRELRHWTQRTAERGISPATAPARLAELGRLADRAAQAGLTTFGTVAPAADAPDGVPAAVDALTRAHLLCLEHESAAGG